jgi:hypothetical protein
MHDGSTESSPTPISTASEANNQKMKSGVFHPSKKSAQALEIACESGVPPTRIVPVFIALRRPYAGKAIRIALAYILMKNSSMMDSKKLDSPDASRKAAGRRFSLPPLSNMSTVSDLPSA